VIPYFALPDHVEKYSTVSDRRMVVQRLEEVLLKLDFIHKKRNSEFIEGEIIGGRTPYIL